MRRLVLVVLLPLLAGCATQQSRPQITRISPEALAQMLPQPQANLSLEEIVDLSRQGVSAEDIIDRIRKSGSSYALTPSQVLDLARRGVDVRVLDHIQSAQQQALQQGFADELNRREQRHREELEALRQQLLSRPYWGPAWGYDPFWGPYPPYWRYSPYYRRYGW